MNEKDWSKIVKEVNGAAKMGRIKPMQRAMFVSKYEGKIESLTEKQVEELNKEYASLVGDNWTSEATKWKELVRRELNQNEGPQYMRLMEKINSGNIKDEEQFKKEFESEKADLKKQREGIKKLKDDLKAKIEKEKAAIKSKCKNIDADENFENLENLEKGIDKLALYGEMRTSGIDILFTKLVSNEPLNKLLKDIEDKYNDKIKQISEYIISENNAIDVLENVGEKLGKLGTQDAEKLMLEVDKVKNSWGVLPAVNVIKSNKDKIEGGVKKKLKELRDNLSNARKAAKNDKERMALSKSELDKINQIAKKPNSELQLDDYKSVKKWMEKNSYKVKVDSLISDLKKLGKGAKLNIINEELEDVTWVMFEDKKDYDNCCKNINKDSFCMVSDIFNTEENQMFLEIKKKSEGILKDVLESVHSVSIPKDMVLGKAPKPKA